MIWHALNVQFNAQSSAEIAATLAAATEARNERVTRKGYSANMLVFGKSISYPELLADEDYKPLTQAQGLDTDAEMLKTCKTSCCPPDSSARRHPAEVEASFDEEATNSRETIPPWRGGFLLRSEDEQSSL